MPGAARGWRRARHSAVKDLGARRLDVDEQNAQAVGFYLHYGFQVVGRSETDGMGEPFPLLHMRLRS